MLKVQSVEKRRLAGFLLAGWCLVIFVLSSIPGNQYPEVRFPEADKIVHVLLYTVTGFLAAFYFRPRLAGYSVLVPILFGILYGLSDEIHQLFVPRRSFSLADLGADSVGVVVGVLMFRFVTNHWFQNPAEKLSGLDNEIPETL